MKLHLPGLAGCLLCVFCVFLRPMSAMSASMVTILYDPRFLLHDSGPGHPEQPARLKQVVDDLQQHPHWQGQLRWPAFNAATRTDLLRVHAADYLALLRTEQPQVHAEVRQLSTGDSPLSSHTLQVAALASGAAMAGVDAVMQGDSLSAFALVRPPGHHASTRRGMGFCIYNHVAVAARYAQQRYGLQRVLIIDIDVHHGNGTQAIFEADPSVFYFSAHQHPLYPGTGKPEETGIGAGHGYSMNVTLAAGSDATATLTALQQQLQPAMQRFKPELVLVSAGLDAHAGDVLGQLQYTDADYAEIARQVVRLASLYAQGRSVWVLEGGYVPEHNAQAVEAILQVLTAQ